MSTADAERVERREQASLPETSPLLPSDRQHLRSLSSNDFIACHVRKIHGSDSWVWRLRRRLQWFLSSKWGHYFVLVLVSLDIACIFADFLISLHVCEHGGDPGFPRKDWLLASDVLGYLSLSFSSLFMAELLGSVFAFGLSYFGSKFHIFDATVIIAAFVVDVLLRGPLEEAGSLVIILRLFRVFKIIEEFSSGAEDELVELQERIERLEREKKDIMEENQALTLKMRRTINGSSRHNHSSVGTDGQAV